MKIKYRFLLITVFIAYVSLFSEITFAYSLNCDHKMYCVYKGMFNNIDNAEEEFAMLMEPSKHPNFQSMFSALMYISGCQRKSNDCAKALKDTNCEVSAYTQQLVKYYENNAADIQDKEVTLLFKMLKDGAGNLFFNKACNLHCDYEMYCGYQGMYNDIDNAEEEFAMLMEPSKHPNFQEMFSILRYIVGCSEKSNDCKKALKDTNCEISAYTKKLEKYYEDNAADILNEEVILLFEILKNIEGRLFFDRECH